MALVRHILRHPDTDQPLVNKAVQVKLAVDGFDDGHAEIVQTSFPCTDATGLLTIDLTPNDLVTPAGTHYTVKMPGGALWSIIVPNTTPPTGGFWLEDLLTTSPPEPDGVFFGLPVPFGADGTVVEMVGGVPAWAPGGGGGGSSLTPTAVKTANYTATASDLVPVDTTSGSVTVTLPTAPADKTQVAVKQIIRGGTNTVTLAASGSDVFNKTGGSTTLTLTLLNQGILLQYKAAGGIWYVVSDDLALGQLDLRYDATGAASAAQSAAISAAATDATTKANNAQTAAVAAADTYTDGKITAEVSRANAAYDAAGAAATAQANAAADATSKVATETSRAQAAEALLAPLASPTFTGHVTVPTPTSNADAATKSYVDGLVTGLYDLRGTYDASGNVFPSSGGSGSAGAVVKADTWIVSVAGTLGTKAVVAGDVVTAVVDAPGQTAANWNIVEHDLGYTPLNAASNLSDLTNAATARSNLGLGTAATQNKVAAGSAGVLDATDPTTTNSRAPSGSAGGDLTGSYPNPTLKNTGTAGTTGDATHVAQVTTDAQGRVTGATAVAITGLPESAVTGLTTDLAAKASVLTRTAVKTGNYTAALWDLVPCDTSGGAFTVTLPAASGGKGRIAIKLVTFGSTLNLALSGSDTFNKTGGGTTGSLSLGANQGIVLESDGTSIWTVTADDIPPSLLAQASNATPQHWGTAASGTGTNVARDDHVHPKEPGVYPWTGDGSDGNVVFDGTTTLNLNSNPGGSYTPSSNVYTVTHTVLGANVTINSGVTVIMQGAALYASGTFTNNGTLKLDGGDASGATGGTGAAAIGGGSGSAGATGGNGAGAQASNAGSDYPWFGGGCQAGGTGSSGSGGAAKSGASSASSTTQTGNTTGHYRLRTFPTPFNGLVTEFVNAANLNNVGARGGYGGSSGGGDGSHAGGGGGGGAGVIIINAYKIAGSGAIHANGGAGAAGVAGNAGGGAGGGGGLILVNTTSDTSTITWAANGGNGGAGVGTGTTGGIGLAGCIQKTVWP